MTASSLPRASLRAAAFGASPEAHPLASPATAEEHWLRAVSLGGQGRYAAAQADLELAARGRPGLARLSLIHSTGASFLRQLGWRQRAARLDGRALSLAVGARAGIAPGEPGDSGWVGHCDALTGLAADALGQGRLALGHRLLGRCYDELLAPEPGGQLWRLRIRWNWVAAELALVSADPATARGYAETAASQAADCPSVRHQVKSALIGAAVAAASGDQERALADVTLVSAACAKHGLLPLGWAAAMLEAGLRPGAVAAQAVDVRARIIRRRGGLLRL